MKRIAWAAIGFAASALTFAQQPAPACDSPAARQLDFWIGDWELSYTAQGKVATSRNRITRILDGCAILEEFSGAPGIKLDGRSFSAFDAATRQWKQTWVDNTASYLDFTGGLVDGRMVFSREAAAKDGRKFLQRMVFDDVKRDSLKWLWQRSDDGGTTWTTQWEIDYKRAR